MDIKSLSLIVAIATATLVAGCQQQSAPPPASADAPANSAVAPAPAEAPPEAPAADKAGAYEAFVPSGPALDHRAFAGMFMGTLPCASCAGIDTQLELKDDYSFMLNETYRESKDAGPFRIKGTWSAEEDGHLLRLDPESKSENDRLFQVVANDEIKLLDADGKPLVGTPNYSLRRASGN